MNTTAIVAKTNGHHAPVLQQQVHGLLQDSIEQIAQGWLDQLAVLKDNATALETQLLTCVADLKAKIEQMHTLGAQVAEEAKRGQEVIAKLSDGIAEIAGDA